MKTGLAKSVADSGWSKFANYHKYKAGWYRQTLIQVDRFFPSSKLCHRYGYKNEDSALPDRTWCCFACTEIHEKDINVSLNLILNHTESRKYPGSFINFIFLLPLSLK